MTLPHGPPGVKQDTPIPALTVYRTAGNGETFDVSTTRRLRIMASRPSDPNAATMTVAIPNNLPRRQVIYLLHALGDQIDLEEIEGPGDRVAVFGPEAEAA